MATPKVVAKLGFPKWVSHFSVPGLVLLVGACATVLTAVQLLNATEAQDNSRLRLEANLAVSALEERIEGHSALLRGTAGLFAGSDKVSADEFEAYVSRLGLGSRYPGVLGIGYAAYLEGDAARDALVADMRRQGVAGFRVWPDDPSPVTTSIIYLSPMNARNAAAIGFDMHTEPRRREAMDRAAVTGDLAMSGKVELVQEIDHDRQPGFVVFMPVRGGAAAAPGALTGFVYSPLRARDLLATVFPARPDRLVDVALYDGAPAAERLLFDTTPKDAAPSRLTALRQVVVAGRPWTLVVRSRPTFEAGSNRHLALWAIPIGAAITLILTLAVFAQARSALLADRARRDLRDLNISLEDRVQARTRELADANAVLKEEMGRREAAESQVRQMQKMEAIGQLTGGIAHDFNNMLAIMVGSLDMARRRLVGGEDPRIARYIDSASEGARRAALLTGRLLAFARRQRLNPEPLDVNRLVASMTELLRRSLGEQVEIVTRPAADLWPVYADAAELENALLNLAVNARDAMSDGGRLTIETANVASGATPAGEHVEIRVRDTGTGMTREVMERAFEPFFTTKEVGRGTGLGLSQVYGFVTQSGGEVTIASEPGEGVTVTIRLPRWVGEAACREMAAPESGPPPRARNGETVLVVEDEADVRRLSVETLRDLGYTVAEAADGPQALAFLASRPPVDLLFTDIVMPGMTGLQLAARARELIPGLKVLYTTGYARDAVGEAGLAELQSALLAKPFNLDQLARKVRETLDGQTVRSPA